MIKWWEPLKRVSQSSHGKISSSGSCLPNVWDHDMLTPPHRLLPDVWDDAMFIPATGFCLMCGMTQFSPPPQALPDVLDDVMLTPATGCSTQCPPNKARALHQGDWFPLGPMTHTQALFITVPGTACCQPGLQTLFC
jgi:hypothetical protein